MRKSACVIFLFVLMGLLLTISACSPSDVQKRTETREQVVPVPKVQEFTEAKTIQRRLELMDDPHLIQWIYCLSESGAVVFYGPVVGKVTSSGKRLEPVTLAEEGSARYGDGWTNERMQADGTFGASDYYVFWFDPNGVYHQWSGDYFLSSVPIKIQTPVINIRDVDQEMFGRQQRAIEILGAGGCVDDQLFEVDCQTRERK